MNKIILFLKFILLCVSAQSQDTKWQFGFDSYSPDNFLGGCDMDFLNNSVTITNHPRIMDFSITNANISDSQGNLLFCTNGLFILNNEDSVMLNGDSLNPGAYASGFPDGMPLVQGALIAPLPGDSNIYYLFHETIDPGINGGPSLPMNLFYTVIDMRLDNGRGEVISKNHIAISDSLTIGGITGIKHANGKDWWIIVRRYNSEIFYMILLTKNGIESINSITVPGIPYSDDPDQNIAQCVFSPDGELYAYYHVLYGATILNFDRCFGIFSFKTFIPISDNVGAGGVAFSPNSRFLYVTSTINIYQFDAKVSNVSSSIDTVAVYDNFYDSLPQANTTFFLAQLAPDGKIYINSPIGVRYLSVIESPDQAGVLCDVQQHSIVLPTMNSFTIPNHLNFKLGPITNSICDTLNDVKELSAGKFILSTIDHSHYMVSINNTDEIFKYSIHDLTGKQLSNINYTRDREIYIDLFEYYAGMYILKFESNDYKIIFKLIRF